MKFYSSKYAMTKGIQEFNGEIYVGGDNTKYADGKEGLYANRFERLGTDAFLTEKEARMSALIKIDRKLGSIEKQAKKLKKLKERFQ